MNTPIYRATMLTGVASIIRLLLSGHLRCADEKTHDTCVELCDTMERAAREEMQQSRAISTIGVVNAAYISVLPPSVMLTDAEKIRAFDRLRATLYPNGHDPFAAADAPVGYDRVDGITIEEATRMGR